jgi:chemotaxis protein methyltransferase CheR
LNPMLTTVELTDPLYKKFVTLVYKSAGISLGDAKRELVRSRLLKRLRALEIATYEEYYELVSMRDPDGSELTRMLDAISTNKTDFFRENQHFEFLAKNLLPGLAEKARGHNTPRIRIWSAGCSSGEEPYTLAMVLRENLPSDLLPKTKILATDISTQMLTTAQAGRYEEEKVKPVPAKIRIASFEKARSPKGVIYTVKPEVRAMITFRRLNLMREKYPFSGKFDVIFCRNVMIYFDRPTQERLVNRFHDSLCSGGHLFIGHSESLNSIKSPFQFIKPTIYKRP